MLEQSCFGESATGAFASCGTARGIPRPDLGCEMSEPEDSASADAGITEQDVKVAEAVIGALEVQEEEGDVVAAAPRAASDAFSEAALSAPLPKAVEEAAARTSQGEMRINQVTGPAIPAAPRTKKIAPADPQPAEGEVSISFEVHRDSAATRAAKAQKSQKRKRKGGLFHGLFGKTDDDDA